MPVQILDIGPASDGDPNKRPPEGYVHNDDYYLERVATEKWAKDLGLPSGHPYRLNRLPAGYAGFEKTRGNDAKHVDRYLYGHRSGPFRSLNEFYPHFKHLMDTRTAIGCPCKLCLYGGSRKHPAASPASSQRVSVPKSVTLSNIIPNPTPSTRPLPTKTQRYTSDSDTPPPRTRQIDAEETPDVYRQLIDRLQTAGTNAKLDEPIEETKSPDWYTGRALLATTLQDLRAQPQYIPRIGDLVLFVRTTGQVDELRWRADAQTFVSVGSVDTSGDEAVRPSWEAGIVTQTPTEPLTLEDLVRVPAEKKHNVVQSGFRIEPVNMPGAVKRAFIRQHRYVPLHAIRPFSVWQDCLSVDEQTWHSTVQSAMASASSFTLIGRFRFKGIWPEATIFCRAIYLGHELIVKGDYVQLYPRSAERTYETYAEIMRITSIKLILVDLDESSDDDYDRTRPYGSCLHFSGTVYTQDPTKSFDGVGKIPIPNDDSVISMANYGPEPWYHVLDPQNPRERMEIPFTRVLGRYCETPALRAWYGPMHRHDASNIIKAVTRSRQYSQLHDSRIDVRSGKAWYWADSRAEQLDLDEINGRSLGMNGQPRSSKSLNRLRKCVKVVDGRVAGMPEDQPAPEDEHISRAEKVHTSRLAKSNMVADLMIDVEDEEESDDDVAEIPSQRPPAQEMSIDVPEQASAGLSKPRFQAINEPMQQIARAEFQPVPMEVIDIDAESSGEEMIDLDSWKRH